MVMTLSDVDRLLEATAATDSSVPARRIRSWRDELAHAAVLLSYARHVLSVDASILRFATEAPDRDLQDVVDELPRLLATASVGGGWSLAPDSPATMESARLAVEGASDGLLAAHHHLARADLGSSDDVERVSEELEHDLAELTERRELVEQRLRDVHAVLVRQYASGTATIDDWLG